MLRLKRWRLALISMGIVLILAAGGVIGTSAYFAVALARVTREVPPVSPSSLDLQYESVQFHSRTDSLLLAGWFIPSDPDAPTVVLVHGEKLHRMDPTLKMLELAHDLHHTGYNVLMFDLRGHGESEGSFFSAGFYERRDVLGAVDFLNNRGIPSSKIVLLGFSLGASTVLMAAEEEPALGALVIDSAFADIGSLIDREAAKRNKIARFMVPLMAWFTKVIYHYDIRSVKPLEAVRHIAVPTLFIYGENDSSETIEASHQLFQASQASLKRLWGVPGANHAKGYRTAPQDYVARVVEFVGKP